MPQCSCFGHYCPRRLRFPYFLSLLSSLLLTLFQMGVEWVLPPMIRFEQPPFVFVSFFLSDFSFLIRPQFLASEQFKLDPPCPALLASFSSFSIVSASFNEMRVFLRDFAEKELSLPSCLCKCFNILDWDFPFPSVPAVYISPFRFGDCIHPPLPTTPLCIFFSRLFLCVFPGYSPVEKANVNRVRFPFLHCFVIASNLIYFPRSCRLFRTPFHPLCRC